MITAVYLRKSRAEENQPISETLARHHEILADYARKERLVIKHVYEEVASGDSLYTRPQMLRLMEMLTTYEAVLCMDIDRLGRGAMHEQGLIFDAFRKAGVLIITPAKTYDMSNDMDDSLISFKALFAREEYKMIRSRLRRGTIKAVDEGCYLSNAPFGYRQVRVNKKPTLEIVSEEASGVKLIFDMYSNGSGCQAIADMLYSLGYKPRRGDKFSRSTVAKIIRNPVYIGKVVWNQYRFERPKKAGEKHLKRIKSVDERVVSDGLHPAIIDELLYNEANKRLKGRYHPPYNNGTVKNPFAGILFCSKCGRVMVRRFNNKQYNQPMIMCPTAGCMMGSALSVVEDSLLFVIERNIKEIAVHPDDVPVANDLNIADSAAAEIVKMQNQLERIADFLEQGIYDTETFVFRRDKLKERIRETQKIIDSSVKTTKKPRLQKKLGNVVERYWYGTAQERNKMLKSAIKKIDYEKPKGSGWKTPPTVEISEWRG